jgi:hypothetical protein
MFTYREKGDYHNLPSWGLMGQGAGLLMLRLLLLLLGVGLLLILLGERGGGLSQVLSPLRLIIEEDRCLVHHHCQQALNMLEDLLDHQQLLLHPPRRLDQTQRMSIYSTLPENLLSRLLYTPKCREWSSGGLRQEKECSKGPIGGRTVFVTNGFSKGCS